MRASSCCATGVLRSVYRQEGCMHCCASQPSSSEAAAQADPAPYETLREEHYAELEVKKSKFLTTAWPISSPEEVPSSV